MLREHRLFIRRVLIYLHVAISFLSYSFSLVLRQRIVIPDREFVVDEWTHLILAGSGIAMLAVLHALMGLYRSHRLQGFLAEARGILLAHAITIVALLAIAAGLRLGRTNRLQLALFVSLNAAAMLTLQLVLRGLAAAARRRGFNYRQLLLVVHEPATLDHVLRELNEKAWWGLRVAGIVAPPLDEPAMARLRALQPASSDLVPLGDCERYLDGHAVDELWIESLPGDSSPEWNLAHAAATRGISVRCLLPRDLFFGARWSVEDLGGLTTLSAARVPIDELALGFKRALDLVVAALALLLAAPVMALAALLVAATGGFPILFRQQRVGLNGRLFTLLKFRTMHRDAEGRLAELRARNEMEGPVFKMRRDPRVTPVGRWLRRLSIDELPQLWNVLRGEMSVVGPRPPLPTEVDVYEPSQRRRLSVRPGMTGLWQVKGRNQIASFDHWVKLDLEYIDRWSLWLDLEILLRTVPAVLFAKGAR